MSPIWDLVHAERAALIEDLRGTHVDDWDRDSLCAGWSVHDVLAHLVDVALTTPTNLATTMVRARLNLDKQNQNGMRKQRRAGPEQTLEAFAAVVLRTSGPPTWLAPLESRLVEEIAHGEDIRRPLGLRRDYPQQSLASAMDYLARTRQALGGGRELVRAMRFEATDQDYAVGSGPAVRGPAIEIVMVLAGRAPRAGSLDGPGVRHIPQR